MAFTVLERRTAHAAGEQPGLQSLQNATGSGPPGGAFRGFALGNFICIARDDRITLIMPNAEMGQGIYTAEATLLAEELEVGLDQVTLEPLPPDEDLHRQPILKLQSVGSSTSIRGAWVLLRQAGAAARTMLVAAAAARWGVPATECRASKSLAVMLSEEQRRRNQFRLMARQNPTTRSDPHPPTPCR
jgi:isoquinoline 1-oxidoreductase subunit beta